MSDLQMPQSLSTLGDYFALLSRQSLPRVALALAMLVVGWVVIRRVNRLVLRMIGRDGRLEPGAAKIVAGLLNGLLFFVLVTLCMGQLGIPITSLVAVLGAVSLAASLAMQDSLRNVAGGLVMMATKPFAVGHFIETDLAMGTVREIGLVHTQLLTPDNRRVYVPNGLLSAATVTNYSLEPHRRVELVVPIPHNAPLGRARQLIEEVIAREPRVLTDPAPFVRVWSLERAWVSVMVRVWTVGGDFFEVKSALTETVKEALDQNGMAFPFDQMEVRLIPSDRA